MGGFGALSVSLRNRHLFGSVVALSPSIRTEKQYMEEGPQKGWDNQWGRIFGGVGKNGKQRLTSYYKQHSPLSRNRRIASSHFHSAQPSIHVSEVPL